MKKLYENTILIVDDTIENIDILVELLENFDNKIATNGKDALETAWEDVPPDLILLDIMMPEMDGYEVCEKLRANSKTKDVPVIFLTAKTEKNDIVKGFEVGGQDYITKPFDARELMERVKTQLELKAQREILKNMNAILEDKVQERTILLNKSNKKLNKANKKLLTLDEAKNQFLKLISHEIRTPLNGIVGSTYFLKEMIDDPELVEFLDMLKESVDRLDKFSQKALEITQMQTVGWDTKKTSVNFNSIIKTIIEANDQNIKDKKLTISSVFCGDAYLQCVEDYFKRTIEELITNAIKYSHAGGEIKVRTNVVNDTLKISVSDTGEVIPAEKIEEIIKPFGLGKDHYDNNIGLGLAYIQTFLDIQNATMEIKSDTDETKITLVFKLC